MMERKQNVEIYVIRIMKKSKEVICKVLLIDGTSITMSISGRLYSRPVRSKPSVYKRLY